MVSTGLGVEFGVEVGVVVHLHLAVELEAALAAANLIPKVVETLSKVAALLLEDVQAVEVAGVVSLTGGGAGSLFARVVDLQRKDGKAVDDKAGGL